MTISTPSAGEARLALISDFPIEEDLLRLVRGLWGQNTSDGEFVFGINRKWCTWPCRVPYEFGSVDDLSFHVYFCAGFLSQRRAVVKQIHDAGCNLELCVYLTELPRYLNLDSHTMRQLADLDIHLSFTPVA